VRRGEVWWANLPAPMGPRPVLLLSRDEAYRKRRSVAIAPITTRVRNIPVEVPLGPEDGLHRPSVVNLDEINTVRISILDRSLATLSPQKMDAVNHAIRFALDLD
jgi:mRNA interferase MazF